MLISVGAALWVAAWVHEWLWIIALALAVSAFVSLWVSRAIAGPFYRIERDLESILSGARGLKPIQVRPGDPLETLAQLVNQLVERSEK